MLLNKDFYEMSNVKAYKSETARPSQNSPLC